MTNLRDFMFYSYMRDQKQAIWLERFSQSLDPAQLGNFLCTESPTAGFHVHAGTIRRIHFQKTVQGPRSTPIVPFSAIPSMNLAASSMTPYHADRTSSPRRFLTQSKLPSAAVDPIVLQAVAQGLGLWLVDEPVTSPCAIPRKD